MYFPRCVVVKLIAGGLLLYVEDGCSSTSTEVIGTYVFIQEVSNITTLKSLNFKC